MKTAFRVRPSMFRTPSSSFRVLTSTFLVLSFAAPQPPRISDGQVTTRTLPAPFPASFASLTRSITDVAWIGYTVPSPVRDGMTCCFHSGDSSIHGTMAANGNWVTGCALEPGAGAFTGPRAGTPPGPVQLEGPDRAYVLFRVAGGRVERIRAFSEGCDLDAGGRPVIWLDAVSPADSVSLLGSLVRAATARDRVVNGALSALAMHAAAESTTVLLDLAREHTAPSVRGEAIFWLAQRAGEKAAGAIAGRVDDDPDTEVKRRAVFALSTLPKDEGVPLLIKIARTHENAAVRKQAFFWLGQSKDPRALEFFAEILR
jgi:hypothetical protein